MKVYRGFDKEIGPISYPYWTYVTPDIEQAKWYATKDGDVKDGAIIEWDLDVDNLRFISLDKLNSFAQSESEIYSEEDLLWYQEGLGEDLEAYIDGIVFKDPYSKKDHTIYIVFRKDDLKNGRILSPEEFDNVQLRESDEQINDILNRAGVQLNEEEVKPFIWTDPSYSQFHKILKNNTTYGKLSAIIDGNHIFCWDSAIKHHDSVIEQIENSGINVSDDAIWVRFKEPNICWVSAAYFDDYTDEELDDLPQQDFELELENNPVIKRYFPNGVKIERFNNLINESIEDEPLEETIIDAKAVGDDLMNIILKNPTRKELTENNMDYSRGALGKNGNFYFISLSELAHIDMFDTLEQLGVDEKPYLTFKYDNKTNTFYFYIPDYDEENLNNCIKELKKSPYIINFSGYTCDMVDDTDFDPELYESVNNKPIIVYHSSDNDFDNFSKEYINSKIHKEQSRSFWFSSSKKDALQYGSILYTCQLNVSKLLKIEDIKAFEYEEKLFHKKYPHLDFNLEGNDALKVQKFLTDRGYQGFYFNNDYGNIYCIFDT